MRLKTFRASNMAEAMASVRTELGPEALILGNRRVSGGVEITAAVEASEPFVIPPLAPPPAPPARTAPTIPGASILAYHNVPEDLARRLVGAPLARILADAFAYAPLPDGRQRPIMLAGPPGAGKTTTCAKIATRHVVSGVAPTVITADSQRAGAADQLAAFTRLLGVSLTVAGDPAVLAKALQRRDPQAPTLIDAPGIDPFDPAQREDFIHLASAAEADLALVIPAGMDADEAAEVAVAFSTIGTRFLIATRLDSARRLGAILAAADAGRLVITEAGIGPGAAGGLEPLSANALAERLGRTRQDNR